MSARETIEVDQIRKGDLIRWERVDDVEGLARAVEYRAEADGHPYASFGTHYLLDRAKPPIVLPSEPTLGWVDGTPGRLLAFWESRDGNSLQSPRSHKDLLARPKQITAFTPAIAVPTEALEALRTDQGRAHDAETHDRAASISDIAMSRFFRAVDAAGEGK